MTVLPAVCGSARCSARILSPETAITRLQLFAASSAKPRNSRHFSQPMRSVPCVVTTVGTPCFAASHARHQMCWAWMMSGRNSSTACVIAASNAVRYCASSPPSRSAKVVTLRGWVVKQGKLNGSAPTCGT